MFTQIENSGIWFYNDNFCIVIKENKLSAQQEHSKFGLPHFYTPCIQQLRLSRSKGESRIRARKACWENFSLLGFLVAIYVHKARFNFKLNGKSVNGNVFENKTHSQQAFRPHIRPFPFSSGQP